MKIRVAEIILVDTRKGKLKVKCLDNEELFTITRMAVILGSSNYYSGFFKYPEKGDRVLLLEQENDPDPVILPIFVPESRIMFEDEDNEFYLVELLHLINNLDAQPGDYVIYGKNDNYVIVRANGNIIFKTGFTKVLMSASINIGGFYTDAMNFIFRSHLGLFALKLLYNRNVGPSAIFEINQPPNLSGDSPLVAFKAGNTIKNFLSFELDRNDGSIRLYSDSFTIKIDSDGNLEYETEGNNKVIIRQNLDHTIEGKADLRVKQDISTQVSGNASIQTSGDMNIKSKELVIQVTGDAVIKATNAIVDATTVTLGKSPQSPIVTGFPDGTMPVCYVTGAPIQGSTTCKAGK